MNKLYQRINWQNYPSDSTPLNESNLNKMDAAVDGIDDRVVTLDVTKLPVSTANTMVKDVTFNETTGVFTITKLNGTKVTVNTALEKIATNFRFDHSTQKLILTLIDGTTQEVDLSALLTQYEFLNSSTIQFTIDSSGKVKASVVNGSITGDMLEPNYLANVTLQASKADTSAKNAKESEEKAAEYAESAKNSADSAEPVASTATGTNPTIQDSTNAPFICGKFKGYTEQQTYSGKNLFSGWTTGKIIDTSTGEEIATATGAVSDYIEVDFVNNSDYIVSGLTDLLYNYVSFYDKNKEYIARTTAGGVLSRKLSIGMALSSGTLDSTARYIRVTTLQNASLSGTITLVNTLKTQTEKGATATPYEPYVGGIASPNPDYPQEISGLAKDGAIEVKTSGKNLCSSNNFTVTAPTSGTQQSNYVFKKINIEGKLKAYKTYTMTADVKILAGSPTGISILFFDEGLINGTEVKTGAITNNHVEVSIKFGSNASKFYYLLIYAGVQGSTAGNSIEFSNVMLRESTTDATYEPYTETTAIIPTDAPLYEGDYLEVYADGSGKEYRKMTEVVLDGSNVKLTGTDIFKTTGYNHAYLFKNNKSKSSYQIVSNIGKGNTFELLEGVFVSTTNNAIYICLKDERTGVLSTDSFAERVAKFNTWLQSNPVTVIYELATPTETPLTAEQVKQFKKLYTFEPVTNVLCDGEVEMIYLKNTNGGKALASVRRGVEHADTATTATKATQDGNENVIAETYYRKTNFDKIVGGTVEPSGKTNVQYSVPTEVSSKGVVVQTTTSGTLINALSKATASISGFFSILYNAVKTRYLGRIDLGMSAIQNTYDFTSFAGYDRYTFVFKGQDANRSLFTRELLTIHNIEKNTSNVGKVCLNISNNYTFEPWVEMYQSGNKTYIVVGITDTTGLTTLVSGLFVEVYGAMD